MAHSPTPDCAHSNDNFKRAQTILISFLIMWAFLLILGVGLGGKQALFHNYSTFFYVALGVRVVACILGIWGALKQHRRALEAYFVLEVLWVAANFIILGVFTYDYSVAYSLSTGDFLNRYIASLSKNYAHPYLLTAAIVLLIQTHKMARSVWGSGFQPTESNELEFTSTNPSNTVTNGVTDLTSITTSCGHTNDNNRRALLFIYSLLLALSIYTFTFNYYFNYILDMTIDATTMVIALLVLFALGKTSPALPPVHYVRLLVSVFALGFAIIFTKFVFIAYSLSASNQGPAYNLVALGDFFVRLCGAPPMVLAWQARCFLLMKEEPLEYDPVIAESENETEAIPFEDTDSSSIGDSSEEF